MQTNATNIAQVSPHTTQDAFLNKHKEGSYEKKKFLTNGLALFAK